MIPSTTVTLGADKSRFQLSMSEISDHEKSISFDETICSGELPKIVLMSDAYITKEMLNMADFYLGYTRPFRYAENTSIAINNTKQIKFKRSKRVYLLTRGSVLFFSKEQEAKEFSEILTEDTSMHAIGYNQHIIVKGEQNVH
jgi:hypothetical protein